MSVPLSRVARASGTFGPSDVKDDGRVLDSESIKLLSGAVLCWLATADVSGNPSVSPKEIFFVRSPDEILIADIASPRSTRNVIQNAQACVAVIDVFEQRGLQVYGVADVIRAGEPEWDVLSAPLIELAGDAFPVRSVIRLSVERVRSSPRVSGCIPTGTRRSGGLRSSSAMACAICDLGQCIVAARQRPA
ncbi:MAG: pyridoxamine 5'-phosphate oxidase family protein [Propionicimonas sp.]|uniref:pyridoxamine 5'-phosphate oxidase family protein n=1 Tax=Propionicimonas sp. TaxID=1955623 RepID=UPI003D0CBA06